MKILLSIALLLATTGCQSRTATPRSAPPANAALGVATDLHSFSRPDLVRVTHVSLDLTLDFEQRVVHGTADLSLERTDHSAPVVLDVQGLDVESVTGADGTGRAFGLGEALPGFGRPLTVLLEPADEAIRVQYRTTEDSEALQWLAPEQTAGGEHPFLFTQGQAIYTRSWIPLQDSPGVRVTYDARVTAPVALTVVMSAEQRDRGVHGTWSFELDRPIPPYLIALACGELASRPVSDRCAVWAEPSVVDAAHAEFIDTEAMIRSAERLYGPYRWGRYDVIILPPAFPFGGMENPLLTFLTPTVIAGDRSLVAIIAHELAHSWSGNLVTNATWRDFWLNEGFTTYFEKRIMEEVFGAERAEMERMLDFDDLVREVDELEPWATVLYIDLDGRPPEDGFSGVAYEKGALFLRRLEELFGRDRFDRFLRSWFDEHAFESVTTPEFESFLKSELLDSSPELARQIDLDEWLRRPGIPADAPVPVSDALAVVDVEVARFAGGAAAGELAVDGWVTQQWLHFLDSLPEDLEGDQMMGDLDAAFDLTDAGNSEVLFAWLRLSIRHGYAPADERLEAFLMTVGRRKYLQPLYEELAKTRAGMQRARMIYTKARPRYHAVSTGTIDEIVLEE